LNQDTEIYIIIYSFVTQNAAQITTHDQKKHTREIQSRAMQSNSLQGNRLLK